ncbi:MULTISPECIES: flavodoxin [Aerococcus]|uniref:Flavodoxin n=3 Tax=Aerococcus TaxID=1375 RepID=A0A5N1GPG5_9LACT|nr:MULTISPECIES: flavodoxin [Aerococcus]KAA9302294.1 flavodoxin [Aerococcus sanguinicola]MDK6369048.1 flavodoxin [Aerococcus sp. UMB9870]MDK6678950.1 flavodoxin [Aerococcus sp. UMB8608]MDK6686541.1 flavodoxin [Aerococcus sp. UMB8623]MDK6939609.1 flavodoxin [Aerococcus sp. UMB8487]
MPKALIIYASLTGNTEEIADVMTAAFEDLGVDCEMVECTDAYGEDFLDADICVVATYTYGTDGDLPDEIVDLYDDLEEVDLTGKVYAALGSGDLFYEKFCQSVIDFDERLAETGAKRGGESVKVDLNPEEDDIQAIEKLAAECLETYQSMNA